MSRRSHCIRRAYTTDHRLIESAVKMPNRLRFCSQVNELTVKNGQLF